MLNRALRITAGAIIRQRSFPTTPPAATALAVMTRVTRSTRSTSSSAVSSSGVASAAVAPAVTVSVAAPAAATRRSRTAVAVAGAVVAAVADIPVRKTKAKRKAASVNDAVAAVDADAIAAAATAAPASGKRARTAGSAKKAKGKAAAASIAAATIPSLTFKFGTLSRELEEELRVSHPSASGSASGCVLIGVDEAGRGPLAGPLVCAAAFVAPGVVVEGVQDSKKMTHDEREAVFAALTAHPLVRHAVAVLDHTEIDRINILEATMRGMEQAAEALRLQLLAGSATSALPAAPSAASAASTASASLTVAAAPSSSSPSTLPPLVVDLALIDGNRIPPGLTLPGEAVVKGDSKMYSIAAASIIAKVTRDRLMLAHHATWPLYNFRQNQGYGVGEHMRAIHRHGPCPIHRMTFAPMKHMRPKEQAGPAAEAAATVAAAAAAEAAPLAAASAPDAVVTEGRRSRSKKK